MYEDFLDSDDLQEKTMVLASAVMESTISPMAHSRRVPRPKTAQPNFTGRQVIPKIVDVYVYVCVCPCVYVYVCMHIYVCRCI